MRLSNYEILINVLKCTGVSKDQFFSKSRDQKFVFARALFTSLATENRSSYREIAAITLQHHSTPGYYLEIFNSLVQYYPEYKELKNKTENLILTIKKQRKMSKQIEVEGKTYYSEETLRESIENAVKTTLDVKLEDLIKNEDSEEKAKPNDDDISDGVRAYILEKGENNPLAGKSLNSYGIAKKLDAKGPLGGKTL
ncbi:MULTISPECIES: hypothetical protein [Elizabethkingia]|uniref:hypothetical protein n=1 Tax=Elizabethkingia TaxID=308865 RepID=UPI0016296127|nr:MULTISPECIES: hypothetical protein [Elizabethkingia]MDV3885256.1 hypothetical protein [Elizabethkingia anophelis]MDX8576829.1 hypothetical protein [Elizabethkingia sp. HX WYD]HCZ8396910.1 hypothetical protein [Elizabethkingia anophelis]